MKLGDWRSLGLLGALLIYFNGTSARAIETWNGVVPFQNSTDDLEMPISIELDESTKRATYGAHVTASGSFNIFDEKIILNFDKDLIYTAFEDHFHPEWGQIVQLETNYKIKTVHVEERAGGIFKISEFGEKCIHFFSTTGGEDDIQCTPHYGNFKNRDFIKADKIRKIKTHLTTPAKIVLPSLEQQLIYANLVSENNVEDLLASSDQPKVVSIKLKDNKIIAQKNDGSFIIYQKITEANGHEILLGVHRNPQAQIIGTSFGPIIKAQDYSQENLNLAGNYRVVAWGTYHSDLDPIFEYQENGYGGFETYLNSSDETRFTAWSWEQTNNQIHEKRWMMINPETGNFSRMASTEEEIATCLNDDKACFARQKRQYTPIQITDSLHVMLRKLEVFSEDGDTLGSIYKIIYKVKL